LSVHCNCIVDYAQDWTFKGVCLQMYNKGTTITWMHVFKIADPKMQPLTIL